MEKLQKIMDFLARNPVQIISTIRKVEGGFVPVSRPFGSALLHDSRIWYCMNKDKPTFEDLHNDSHVCICACNADRSWIRIHATAKFVDSIEVKQEYIKRGISRFKNPADSLFCVFYLDEITAEIHANGAIGVVQV